MGLNMTSAAMLLQLSIVSWRTSAAADLLAHHGHTAKRAGKLQSCQWSIQHGVELPAVALLCELKADWDLCTVLHKTCSSTHLDKQLSKRVWCAAQEHKLLSSAPDMLAQLLAQVRQCTSALSASTVGSFERCCCCPLTLMQAGFFQYCTPVLGDILCSRP